MSDERRVDLATAVRGEPIPDQDHATPHMVPQRRQEPDYLPAADGTRMKREGPARPASGDRSQSVHRSVGYPHSIGPRRNAASRRCSAAGSSRGLRPARPAPRSPAAPCFRHASYHRPSGRARWLNTRRAEYITLEREAAEWRMMAFTPSAG
jgi:hypothetical protein